MANVVNIAKEYSTTLGGRWIRLGEFSGEDFFNKILEPMYLRSKKENSILTVELDGTTGYPSSFLDQSFGELARKYGKDNVKNTIEFKAKVFSWVADYIISEIWDKTKE